MNPGDVVLHSFSLSGFDVRQKVSEFSVFENMMKPYASVSATIVDNADLLNNLFSQLDVELTLSFSQLGQDPYENTFAVTSVEKGKSSSNMRVSTYTISGYSRHMLKLPRVQKAYREMSGTDIASDLIKSFLSPDKGLLVRDAARGVMGNQHMPYNVNGVQIHKAIRGVLERAVSGVGSAYMFFENNKNMVVDTLENMLNNRAPVATYIQRPMGQNWLRDQVLQNFVILSMREESRTDRSDRVQAENQQVNPFDIFSHVNDNSIVGDKGLVSTIVNLAYNAMRPPTYLAQTMPGRKHVAAAMDSQALTIHVPLNPALTVGSGFAVDLIAPLGDTDGQVRDFISGNLLATEVRHSVDLGKQRMQGTSTVRGSKGGMP